MARKSKTQPSPDDAGAVPVLEPTTPDEAVVPPRRGKAKAAALSYASPAAADVGSPATDDAGADASKADPIKTPGRRGPGRKPKQAAGAEIAPSIPDGAAGPQDQAPHEHQAGADPDLSEDDGPMAAAAPQAEAAADSDPVQPGFDPSSSADEAAQSFSEADASVPTKAAAHWDRATGRVQLDWPTIEQVAAQDGPNQALAKLLVAARAEGAQSRWPF